MKMELQKAFTRLHFEQMELMVKLGRFHGIPIQDRSCICGAAAVEDLTHILDYQLYTDIREYYLDPLQSRWKPWDWTSSRDKPIRHPKHHPNRDKGSRLQGKI